MNFQNGGGETKEEKLSTPKENRKQTDQMEEEQPPLYTPCPKPAF